MPGPVQLLMVYRGWPADAGSDDVSSHRTGPRQRSGLVVDVPGAGGMRDSVSNVRQASVVQGGQIGVGGPETNHDMYFGIRRWTGKCRRAGNALIV